MFDRIITDDEADFGVLSKANEKRKFAIPVSTALPGPYQLAFERGIDSEWFALVDVAPIAAWPGAMMRIFRLTEAGMARRDELLKAGFTPANLR